MNEAQAIGLEIIAEIAGRPASEITPDQDLVAELGIDSPKALRMLLDLEDRLDLEIHDEDAAKMDTVGDVLDYLRHVSVDRAD